MSFKGVTELMGKLTKGNYIDVPSTTAVRYRLFIVPELGDKRERE